MWRNFGWLKGDRSRSNKESKFTKTLEINCSIFGRIIHQQINHKTHRSALQITVWAKDFRSATNGSIGLICGPRILKPSPQI